MNKVVIIAAAVGLVLSSGAHAVDAEKAKALAQSKNCLACHAIDKKLVGPAYTEVSKKYKGNKDAEAMLVAKLKEGKAHPKVAASDAELKECIQAVLATK